MRIKEPQEFLKLADRLKGSLGDKIIEALDLKRLMQEIINIVGHILQVLEDVSLNKQIVEYAMSILVTILVYSQESLELFLSMGARSEKLVINGLFWPVNSNLRKVFSHSLYLLVRQKNDLVSGWLMPLLMENLPKSGEDTKKDCVQYYQILCKVIEELHKV